MALLWFHAFNRPDIKVAIAVVRNGPSPNPNPNKTKANEAVLGVVPPHVYFCLGRAAVAFGEFAVAVRGGNHLSLGTMCPFDSGGLVERIEPVCGWDQNAKRAYLTEYSWSTADLDAALSKYPGTASKDLALYLGGESKPPMAGPHNIWHGRTEADIWARATDWRAWSWEGRWPEQLLLRDTLDDVVAWTCPPARNPEVFDLIDHLGVQSNPWLPALMKKWVKGGIGALVDHLRERQAPT